MEKISKTKGKIVRLSENHYVFATDSEIKKGDVVCEKLLTDKYELLTIQTLNDIDFETQLKITHSTQPLEPSIKSDKHDNPKEFVLIKPLSLSEVEEAIYGYSVEKMAERLYSRVISENEYDFKRGFEIGFNVHKELVKDKLFTVEDMINAFVAGTNSGVNYESLVDYDSGNSEEAEDFAKSEFEEFKKSLLPKTEWDAEIDEQGNLKLI